MGFMIEVVLSSPRGFCAGVVRAIDVVRLSLERYDSPVYVRKEIVHNPHVVGELSQQGAIFVDELLDVPPKSTVIFSAHGVSPKVRQQSKERQLNVIDATCPLVTKVHLEAIKYAREGYTILLVGHKGHEEVDGTMGEAPDVTTLVEDTTSARNVEVRDPEKVVVLTQTTLSVRDTLDIIDVLRGRFPKMVNRNDICYATSNRQTAVKEIANEVELVLVIGAENSSNCNRLREVAEAEGVTAYLVNGPDQLKEEWFEGITKIGVTSGASTPEWVVNRVVESLNPSKVRDIGSIEENVSFVLPKELR